MRLRRRIEYRVIRAMFDTHCHLTDPRIYQQLDRVLIRAVAAGVTRMVTIGTHRADWPVALQVASEHAQIRCALGVHPNYCHEAQIADIEKLGDLLANQDVVAVGEMGLDYHHKFAPRDRQAEFFRAQLTLARELDQPVVIHCREAVEDCLEIMRDYPVRAVFHCFTGTADEARRIVEAGYLLGFTGVVTFKNSQALRDIAAQTPADRILLETDAPYLSPEPMRREKTNEPALVVYTAAAVAAARGIEIGELDRITTENANRFYGWKAD
jgi:TatD DNase family protein